MVHSSFVYNNSESFPGIQILAFIYNETNEFSDFQTFEQEIQDNDFKLNHVNFTALLPDQERLFTAIRSCLWDGNTLESALAITHLKKPLSSIYSLSQNIVARLNRNLAPTEFQLPANVTNMINQITWGTHAADLNSTNLIFDMVVEMDDFIIKLQNEWQNKKSEVYKNVTGDSQFLVTQLNALNAFITITDCQHVKETYNELEVNFCRAFLGTSNMIAWLLILLCTITVLSFFVMFYAGHRVFSRPLPVRPQDSEKGAGAKSVNNADARAPLLSSDNMDKQYYNTGPVTYSPPPPVYSFDASTAYEKL